MLKNWLLNPTGKEDSFVEVDLVQEHLNFWIKAGLTNSQLYHLFLTSCFAENLPG